MTDETTVDPFAMLSDAAGDLREGRNLPMEMSQQQADIAAAWLMNRYAMLRAEYEAHKKDQQ